MKEKFLNRFRGYRRQPLSVFLFIATSLAALITFCVLIFLVAYVLISGIPHLKPSLFEWKYTTENQSLTPALFNTISITLLSLLMAVPLGIASAIYLTEYANKKSKIVSVISMTAETLSGIPSIVYGLFGNLFFLTALGWGYSLISGACTLAIMQVQNDLKAAGQLASAGQEISGERFLPSLKGHYPELRVTLIAADGSVVFDSDSSAGAMTDHSNRPEVIAAKTDGEGFALRHSDTLDETMYYYALRLADGQILRVSRAAHSFQWVLQNTLPLLLLVCAAMFLLCLILSSLLTQRILAPVNALQARLYDADPDDVYEELSPFLAAIRRQQSNLQAQKERIEREKDRITLISENMSEGLILLDTQRNILLINHSAAELLGTKPGEYTGRNILTLTRNLELLQAVEGTAQKKSSSIVLSSQGRYVQVFISPAMVSARSGSTMATSGVISKSAIGYLTPF